MVLSPLLFPFFGRTKIVPITIFDPRLEWQEFSNPGNRKTDRLTDRVTDRQKQNEREMIGHSVRGGETNKHRNDMSVCVCVCECVYVCVCERLRKRGERGERETSNSSNGEKDNN
jgi:hypothetical protein